MADGTIMIVLDVFNQVETFTKIILIMAAPIKVAPGVENPNSTDSILRIHTHSTPPIPMDTNSLTGALKKYRKSSCSCKRTDNLLNGNNMRFNINKIKCWCRAKVECHGHT